MRMRFKPYAHDELMAADFHVHEPLIWGGRWHAQYARPEQPFVLELGCGKGGFISQLASAHPENNYLGIDITDKSSFWPSGRSRPPIRRRAAPSTTSRS